MQGLTPSFNTTTSPYKYLFTLGPIWVGQSNASPNCLSFDLAVANGGVQSQQFLAEMWRSNTQNGAMTLLKTSGDFALGGNVYVDSGAFWIPRLSAGGGCTDAADGYTIKVYSTTSALALTAYVDFVTAFDTSYRTANLAHFPTGDFSRTVMTASFSFGSSAGVCATTPENSIKVHSSNSFPASPVFGDFGWANSGAASNSDTCSGSAFADLFLRSSAQVSGNGKWTFIYEVPNGAYDVTILYNTSSASAGDTTITLNGRTVVNAESAPQATLSQVSQRMNVGGNQILVGVSSASGTAVLNGVIVTPVAQ